MPDAAAYCENLVRAGDKDRWLASLAALLEAVGRYGLETQALVDLIEARAFDLYADPMPSLDAFAAYGRRTASGLIELAARVLDPDHADVGELAAPAGIAYATTGLIAVA
jgi:phytoene synthase